MTHGNSPLDSWRLSGGRLQEVGGAGCGHGKEKSYLLPGEIASTTWATHLHAPQRCGLDPGHVYIGQEFPD